MPNTPPTKETPVAPVFSSREVLCRTETADADSLLAELVHAIAVRHDIAGGEQAALDAVKARQAAAPVFVAPGVAVPHARIEGLSGTYAAVATSVRGVRFEGSEEPVKLAVLVLTPAESPAAYLRVLAGVARRLSEPGFLGSVLGLDSAEAVAARLLESGQPLEGDVIARDLMVEPPAVLRETNSVKEAIDTIVRTGLSEIPVVDKEGDLVGVASARALLRVCIPEYLLWMEDLSRFSNFEPFETILKKESSTWLADITDDEYASVPADGPAIAVAEALARHGTEACYVLDGAKLAGVVTLPRFLHNVFRD